MATPQEKQEENSNKGTKREIFNNKNIQTNDGFVKFNKI